jgi:hypothetical protein
MAFFSKQLEALLLGDNHGGIIQGWRRKLIGKRLRLLHDLPDHSQAGKYCYYPIIRPGRAVQLVPGRWN